MNKELYIKHKKKLEELKKISLLTDSLKTFIKDNNKKFKNEESIEALKKIKIYIETKEKEYNICENKQKEIYKKLYTTCQHEFAINKYGWDYHCMICNKNLGNNFEQVLKNSIISIDTERDYETAYIIENILETIIYSDKNLIKTFTELIEELQYDKNIKVYRRKI